MYKIKATQIIFTVCLLLSVVTAALFSFSDLGTAPFVVHDETTHASVAYNMYKSGDYWHPQFNGSAYHNKPPLKIWLTAASLKFFKPTPLTFRFLSALAGAATAVLLFIFVNSIFHSGLISLFSVLVFFTSKTLLFSHTIRSGTQDSAMLFFSTLVLFTAWPFLEKCLENSQKVSSKELILKALVCGVSMGCAVLTKSVAGFLPLIVLGLFYLFTLFLNGFNKKIFIFLCLTGIVSVLLAATWYAHLFIVGNAKSLLEIDRFQTGFHNSDVVFIYFHHLYQSISFPFCLWLPALLITFLQLFFGGKEGRLFALFLLSWGIGILLFITCLSSRVEHYIAPAIPAYVIMVTNAVVLLWKLCGKWFRQEARLSKFLSLSAFAAVIFFISVTVRADINNYRHIKRDARIVNDQQHLMYSHVIDLINSLKTQPEILFLEDEADLRLPHLVRYFYNLLSKYPINVIYSVAEAEEALKSDKAVIVIDDANRIADREKYYMFTQYLPRVYFHVRWIRKAERSSVLANFQVDVEKNK